LQSRHCSETLRIHGIVIDVRFARHLNIAVTENRLDDGVWYSQPVKVCGEFAAKCMPPVPRDPCLNERRFDHLAREVIEISAASLHSLEQDFLRAKRGDVSIEDMRALGCIDIYTWRQGKNLVSWVHAAESI
jgi:hypothetical protein